MNESELKSSIPEQPSQEIMPPSYVQTLKDIRNMLWCAAVGSLTSLTFTAITEDPLNDNQIIVRLAFGFCLGIFIGLPVGRLSKF